MNIYIGNLPKPIDEETIRNLFVNYGEVGEIKLIKDHTTGELRGFGFIDMPSDLEAQKAIEELNGKELEGSTLIVNQARSPRDKSGDQRRGGKRGRGPRFRPR